MTSHFEQHPELEHNHNMAGPNRELLHDISKDTAQFIVQQLYQRTVDTEICPNCALVIVMLSIMKILEDISGVELLDAASKAIVVEVTGDEVRH